MIKQPLRKYFYFAVLWAGPALLFWCLRWGNSIRHMMIAIGVLIFMFSILIVYSCADRRKLYFVIPVLVIMNYFLIMPVENNYINKGGRLFETARRIQAYHNEIKKNGCVQ